MAIDYAIRHGAARADTSGQLLRRQAFLRCSCVPLGRAPSDYVTAGEVRARRLDMFDESADIEAERGCSL